MVSMRLSSFAMHARCCLNYSDILSLHRTLVTRLLSQGYKVNHLSYGRHIDLIGQYKKISAKFLLILSVGMSFIFMDLPMAELIKLAKIGGCHA